MAGSVSVAHELADGETLDLGDGVRMVALHTPGHSPGSTSFLVEPDGVLLCGDAVPQFGGMPIYDDVLASARSLRRLLALEGVHILAASWEEPRQGADARKALMDGLRYLQEIDQAVERCRASAGDDLAALCQNVVGQLGLPVSAANPLVARSLRSHLDPGRRGEIERTLVS